MSWDFRAFYFSDYYYLSFNVGEGQEENAIVTSTGQFVVAWDFGKVKKGQTDRYEIKKYVFPHFTRLNALNLLVDTKISLCRTTSVSVTTRRL
jgi:hypothetical protein